MPRGYLASLGRVELGNCGLGAMVGAMRVAWWAPALWWQGQQHWAVAVPANPCQWRVAMGRTVGVPAPLEPPGLEPH